MQTRTTFKAMGALFLAGVASAWSEAPETRAVDKIFEPWAGKATPGCAVGVSLQGRRVLERAYGMADLEHAVANTPDTLFEAGSVSKQFTAAAVVLLAEGGALSLDEPVRRLLPELPDYGAPISLRQMLHHLSGLRDWGFVAFAGGWPRGSRVYTQDHALDIASRQRSLNYPPGSEYLYCNTGYTLAAIAVARASGGSLADFTRKSLFEPLHMARTSWRDDYARVVPGRAVAYAKGPSGYRMAMPFENVHGHAGLLTTVGDLLEWNENLSHPAVGGPSLVREMEAPGRLLDGRPIRYGLGLNLGELRGVREVGHSGTTAGYRAFLARYPDQQVSVAVLCNAGEAPAPDLGRRVAAIFLGGALAAQPARFERAVPELAARAGLYRDTRSGEALRITATDGAIRLEDAGELVPMDPSVMRVGDGRDRLVFDGSGGFRYEFAEGDFRDLQRVPAAAPTRAELEELQGAYESDEAEVTYRIEVEGSGLVLAMRPSVRKPLQPLYRDAFSGPGTGLFVFRRDEAGRVTSLSLVLDRVRDLRFLRVPGGAAGGSGGGR